MVGLLRAHADFRRLWIGDVLSKFGGQVLLFAVPVLAATVLSASTWEVALLSTFAGLPYLLLGLPIGAWADRLRRRPILIGADVARAVVLLWVPLGAVMGELTVQHLYVVQFLAGVGTVFFDVAQGAYLPFLVGRSRLVDANGAMEANRTVTYTIGPSVAGQLVTWFGAAVAVTATVVGFLWSALWLAAIKVREPAISRAPDRRIIRDIREGLRFTLGQPFVRATTFHATCAVLCLSTRYAIEPIFLLRTVGLSPASIGLLMAGPGLGAVLGAVLAARIASRLGRIRTVLLSGLAMGASSLLIPLAEPGWRLAFYVVGAAVVAGTISVNNVTAVSVRQLICPNEMLGRMNATSRFIAWATLPLGGVVGGALGTAIGLRPTLWLSGVGMLAASLWLVLSPATRARDLDDS